MIKLKNEHNLAALNRLERTITDIPGIIILGSSPNLHDPYIYFKSPSLTASYFEKKLMDNNSNKNNPHHWMLIPLFDNNQEIAYRLTGFIKNFKIDHLWNYYFSDELARQLDTLSELFSKIPSVKFRNCYKNQVDNACNEYQR